MLISVNKLVNGVMYIILVFLLVPVFLVTAK